MLDLSLTFLLQILRTSEFGLVACCQYLKQVTQALSAINSFYCIRLTALITDGNVAFLFIFQATFSSQQVYTSQQRTRHCHGVSGARGAHTALDRRITSRSILLSVACSAAAAMGIARAQIVETECCVAAESFQQIGPCISVQPMGRNAVLPPFFR